MVDLPPGFRVVQPNGGAPSSAASIPAGFRVVQPQATKPMVADPTQVPADVDGQPIPLPLPGGGAGYVDPNAPDPRHGEWNEPGAIAPVQFQQGTGAMRLAVPKLLTDAISAVTTPGKAARGEYDEVEVLPDGSVSRFDPEMIGDATNLASMVSPVTPAARISTAAARSAVKVAMPEIEDLYATKDAAYKAVDQLGARYTAQAYDDLAADMIKRAAADNISETRHPKAYSMLSELQQNPRELSLTELDQMRQTIRRDLVGGDRAEAHFGRMMIDAIDDFIEGASPSKIRGASPEAANLAITTARKANTVLRKSETLQDAMEAARLRAASSGSGGNIDNSIRQELRRIILSPKKSMGFTPDELAAMEQIVVGGGKGQDLLRKIGKLSPSGNGLMAALGIGATMANPVSAVIPAAALAAKHMSDRATDTGVNALTKMVRSGGNAPNAVSRLGTGQSPITPKATTTLLNQHLPNSLVAPPNSVVRLSL